MPLRDHFRPPLNERLSWQELHGQWPGSIVRQLRTLLPPGYVAGPQLHSGSQAEIDVATFERDDAPRAGLVTSGPATAVWAPPRPSLAVETALDDHDEYEVRVYDARRGRTLVAAIEIVSPANKDRPEHRNAFVGKCAALLRRGVAVSVVDVVTVRPSNLYAELLEFVGHGDPALGDPPPPVYAAACRWVRRGGRAVLEGWSHALAAGQPLPTLPLWLGPDLAVPLDLERGYEQACYDLWIE